MASLLFPVATLGPGPGAISAMEDTVGKAVKETRCDALNTENSVGPPPRRVTVVFDDANPEVSRTLPSTGSERARQFELDLLENTWPAGSHVWRCGPGEQKFDAALLKGNDETRARPACSHAVVGLTPGSQ